MDPNELNARYWSEIPAGEITSAYAVPGPELLALLPAGASVLEVGCGNGHLAEHLAAQGCRVTAVDINADAIARNRARATGVAYDVVDLRDELPFPPASFDAVCSCFVLGNLLPRSARERVVEDLSRILRPEGVVWLREPTVSPAYETRYDASLGDAHDFLPVTRGSAPRVTHHFTDDELDGLFHAFERASWQETETRSPATGLAIRTTSAVYRLRAPRA